MKIPDLLFCEPYLAIDRQLLEETLGLAFLGRELGTQLHDHLAKARLPPRERLHLQAEHSRTKPQEPSTNRFANAVSTEPDSANDLAQFNSFGRGSGAPVSSTFRPEFYGGDLFLRTLLEQAFPLRIDKRDFPVNLDFLQRVIEFAPTDHETISLRQGIFLELENRPDLLARLEDLYRQIFDLLSLMKTPGSAGILDLAEFRLDILHQLKKVIDQMAADFANATSALHRLHASATLTQQEEPYRLLTDLLEYEQGMAKMTLDVTIGADGRLRSFLVKRLEENEDNPFYKTPGRRFFDSVRLGFRGYGQSRKELMNRLVNEVFRQLAEPMVPYVQLLGHLEFYLTSLGFRKQAKRRGLQVSLPSFNQHDSLAANTSAPDSVDSESAISGSATSDQVAKAGPSPGIQLKMLFNPLLLQDATPPTPCSLSTEANPAVVLITGPNSGGKTRLLQALGLTQLLAQSGTYVPCAEARLQLQTGMFISLIEEEGVKATEGRLGRELVRIRSLFEEMAPGSLVILDELCSGTNPSEGVEVFTMVLRLLQEVRPTAFVTTHFLDFARSLRKNPVISGLEFMKVEVDDDLRSTYQFVPGVADTSLAGVTAERLGVTFERLAKTIRDHDQDRHPEPEQESS